MFLCACVCVCVCVQIVVLETQLGELNMLLEESNVIANTKMQVQKGLELNPQR